MPPHSRRERRRAAPPLHRGPHTHDKGWGPSVPALLGPGVHRCGTAPGYGAWVPSRSRWTVRWAVAFAGIGLLGLAVRLTFLFAANYHIPILGDAFYYHYGANLLADGKGFIQPQDYYFRGWTVQAAEHPP